MSAAAVTKPTPIDPEMAWKMCRTDAGRKAVENHVAMLRDFREQYVAQQGPKVESIRRTLQESEALYRALIARLDADIATCESALGGTGAIAL